MTRATYIALLGPVLIAAVFCGAFWASHTVKAPNVDALAGICDEMGGEWLQRSARPICVHDGALLVYSEQEQMFIEQVQLSRAQVPVEEEIEMDEAAQACAGVFEAFPGAAVFNGRATVDFATLPEAAGHRTAITKDVNAGVNFAGAYVLATWGCGDGCRGNAVINGQTGAILAYDIRSRESESYSQESALVIFDAAGDSRAFVLENAGESGERIVEYCGGDEG